MDASLLPRTVIKASSITNQDSSITKITTRNGEREMLSEILISFILILSISLAIYLIALIWAPKSRRGAQHISVYACGEKVRLGRIFMNITFYKYLAYFVILDSSIIIAAFASLALNAAILPFLLIYLCAILAAVLLLTEGDAGSVSG